MILVGKFCHAGAQVGIHWKRLDTDTFDMDTDLRRYDSPIFLDSYRRFPTEII
jgi:hypothetical protein